MNITIPALGRGLLLLFLAWLALPAGAASVSGLYEAEVPAAGEDTASRNEAIALALQRVLVKLTGRDPAPGAGALTAEAARYVQQFRFQREVRESGEAAMQLWVRFDKAGLDRALRDRGLPLWGSSRPGLLVWMAAEFNGRRGLVAGDELMARVFKAHAAVRGLPVQWPLLDLEDQARLSTADLWSDYGAAVTEASRRYGQPLVLTGRLRQVAADHWEARWTLYEGGEARVLTATGGSAGQAVGAGVGQVVDLLADRYAPLGAAGGPELVNLRIEGLVGVQDYARVLQLVGQREVVERVAVRGAERDSVLLEVYARGGREALSQVLDLVRGLERQPDPLPPQPQPRLPEPVTAPPLVPEAPAGGGAPVVDAQAALPGAGSVPQGAGSSGTAPGSETAPQEGNVPLLEPIQPPAPPRVDLVYRLIH